MRLLEGKIVLITGAARGIGKTSAFLMAKEGADVGVIDIHPEVEGTSRGIKSIGRKSATAIFDISDPVQVHEGLKRFGKN